MQCESALQSNFVVSSAANAIRTRRPQSTPSGKSKILNSDFLSSAMISFQAYQPRNMQSRELQTEKVLNSDCVKRCHVVRHDQDPSVGDSCIAHYFEGKNPELRNYFRGKKFPGWRGSYPKEWVVARLVMKGSTTVFSFLCEMWSEANGTNRCLATHDIDLSGCGIKTSVLSFQPHY